MDIRTKRVIELTAAAVVGGATAAVVLCLRSAWRGMTYLPDDTRPVADRVLADRVRSRLGQLEHRLDIPHVHVMVERHVALLHGDVTSAEAARAIEAAALATPGIMGVESHLHVGLLAGDTRPSMGGGAESPARTHLVNAARRAGAGEVAAPLAAQAVLGVLGELLPPDVHRQLASHLPADAAALLVPPRRPMVRGPITEVHELFAAVNVIDVFPPTRVPWVVDSVLGALQSLVPDDVGAVGAALPANIRHLWEDASVASPTA